MFRLVSKALRNATIEAVALIAIGCAGTGTPAATPSNVASFSPAPTIEPSSSPSPTPAPTPAVLASPSATVLDDVAVTSIPLGVDAYPLDVVSAFGSIWVAEHRHDLVRRLDPTTLQTIAEVGPIIGPGWFAVTPDAVWVTNQNGVGMSRIDPSTNAVAASVGDLPTCGVPAYALGSIWYAACDTDELVRIDPKTATVTARVPAEGRAWPIAIDGALYASGPAGLGRFDDATGRIVEVGGCCGEPIGFDGHTVWLYDAPKVVRVDPDSGHVVGRMSVPLLGRVAFRDGSAWLTIGAEGLREVDIDSGKVVRTVATGSTPLGIIDIDGVLWVTDQVGDLLWRLQP